MSAASFWKTRAGRSGEVHRARKAGVPDRFAKGDFTKFQCQKCGAPGPRLCVCDDEFDKLIARVVREEDKREPLARGRR